VKRIAVLVSGGGTNLQALIDAAQAGAIPHGEIKLVVSSSKLAYALTRAANAGIETAIVRKKDYPDAETFDKALADCLSDHKIDMVVLAGYLCILGEHTLHRYADRIINIHPSLIPSFCGDGFYGLKVHEAALARGVKITGATVHLVNEITDGGRILLQKAVEVLPNDTAETLQRRVMEQAEWKLLPQAVEMVAAELDAQN